MKFQNTEKKKIFFTLQSEKEKFQNRIKNENGLDLPVATLEARKRERNGFKIRRKINSY